MFNRLAKSGYEPKEYSSALHNNSLPCWTWLIGQEQDVIYCEKKNKYKLSCIFSFFLISFKFYVIIICTNPRRRVTVRVLTKNASNKVFLDEVFKYTPVVLGQV